MREILLVEDNEIIVKGLKYLLEQEKFDIKIAKNIVEAKTIIKKQKFDLYLLDITLPDGDGYEICQYVKKQKDVPVIFLTAKDEELNVVQCLDMGADDYITKPAKVKILKTDTEKNISRLEIVIHEGKNRQVRKMCESVGKKVLALHRSKIGKIGVKDIELGKWRYLKDREIQELLKNK